MTDSNSIHKAELLKHMQDGWDELQAYIQSLTEAQMTGPSDAAGWTVKDHLIHVAMWEDDILALLQKRSRHEHLGIDEASWKSGDFDRMNAIIQQRYRDTPLDQVLQTSRAVHEHLVEIIQSMTDQDLHRSYSDYQPEPDQDRPVIGWIIGATYEHYREHIACMNAIGK
jgi:uncharacterized protein (TIGR03083 family)